MRTGLIAKKLGMSRRIFGDSGRYISVTVLQVNDLQVTAVRSLAKNGYTAVQLGCGLGKAKHVSKPMRGHFAKAKVRLKRKLAEFRVSEKNLLKVGDTLSPSHFVVGQKVDATGFSIGKGFSGSMKRHNFGGLAASHGVSISHRAHGSTGHCQEPAKVFKGKKMAGHMGAVRVTTQNLKVVSIEEKLGVLFVQGSVPGSKGGWVLLRDSIKLNEIPKDAPLPAGLQAVADTSLAEGKSEEEPDNNTPKSDDKNEESVNES